MGDLLASAADLRTLLEQDVTGLPDAQAEILLEMATSAVQAAAGGQFLVEWVSDTATIIGTTESWLDLPQRPVTAVASVKVDGTTVTDFKRFGNRLWRSCGWAVCAYEPSAIEVVYSHGFPAGDQRLQFARTVALGLAAQIGSDPTGKVTGFSIDDYQEQRAQAGATLAGLIPGDVQRSLRRQYGRRGGLVRIG
jgi:hypothetical protein